MDDSQRRELAREVRKKAEALNGERWYAMSPPWSGQFVFSGDEDPHVGRFVCSTDPALHMDEEELKDYEGDDPAERVDFIAYFDPATVLALARELEAAQDENERKEYAIQAAWRFAEIVCEGMAGRPTADDTARFVDALVAAKE
jgi:hypothetical protein